MIIGRLLSLSFPLRSLPHAYCRMHTGLAPPSRFTDSDVGTVFENWEITNKHRIEDKKTTIISLSHLTGARHLHVDNEDPNLAFAVAFRTFPEDSKGVAHILEHTALCGSKKYPVRDPFFHMLKRSVSTYMNAWTGADFTAYPFSTTLQKDYHNLLDVYLDAVFSPNLNELDFLQEGHRLAFSDPQNKQSEIGIKGVVFNEMKGVCSDFSNFFHHQLFSNLYPNSTYSHNSGGDPLVIPNLSYKELTDFHDRFYRPSNSRFFSYGELELEKVLSKSNSVLNQVQRSTVAEEKFHIPPIQRFQTPKVIREDGPIIPGMDPDRSFSVARAYLTAPITDPFEMFSLSVLSAALLSGPQSFFHRNLLNTNIGNTFSPSTGFHQSFKEVPFSVGLQGVAEADIDSVFSIIDSTFREVYENGIPEEKFNALLDLTELESNHIKQNHGIDSFGSLLCPWIHGCNEPLLFDVDQLIQWLRKAHQDDPKFFSKLVAKYFVDNQHYVDLIVRSTDEFSTLQKSKEEEMVKEKIVMLTESEKERIVENQTKLVNYQNKQMDANDYLPIIKIEEITDPKKDKIDRSKEGRGEGTDLFLVHKNTNNLYYIKFLMMLNDLSPEIKPYVPLFCNVLSNMSTKKFGFEDLSGEIDKNCIGFDISPYAGLFFSTPEASPTYDQGIYFKTYGYHQKMSDTLSLLHNVLTETNFSDVDRLTTLLNIHISNIQEDIIQSGHRFATLKAESLLYPTFFDINEKWNGLSQLQFLKKLGKDIPFGEVSNNLQAISDSIPFSRRKIAINADPKALDEIKQHLHQFSSNLNFQSPSCAPQPSLVPLSVNQVDCPKEFYGLPVGVNFLSKSIVGPIVNQPLYAPLAILCHMLSSSYLHKEIREKGGAYGAWVRSSGRGSINFGTYRDPNLSNSLKVFENSLEWIKDNLSDDNIYDAKLSLLKLQPEAPGHSSESLFLSNLDSEM